MADVYLGYGALVSHTMTHAALSEAVQRARGLDPGGSRLSMGVEDCHDRLAELRAALALV